MNSIRVILIKYKTEILIAVGVLCALILLFASGCEKKETKSVNSETADYEEIIEKKLTSIISEMDGTGSVTVMVTADCGKEYVYAQNEEIGNDSLKSSYFSNGDREPVLIKEIDPQIRGVAVICDGGDNTELQGEIIELVSGVLKIPTNRIFVGS